MNPTIYPLMVVPVAVVSLVPSAVLVWYMIWRRRERRETAEKIDTLVAALSRTEGAVDRAAQSRECSAEDYTGVGGAFFKVNGTSRPSAVAAPRALVQNGDDFHSARPFPSERTAWAQEAAAGEISAASIGKAKALLRGGISPVEVARTLNIGLGEVTLLHRMIGVIEQRRAVPA